LTLPAESPHTVFFVPDATQILSDPGFVLRKLGFAVGRYRAGCG
jgi:hypothetical protein